MAASIGYDAGWDMSFNLSCIIREAGVSTPDKPVAYHVGGTLTFRELDEQSDRLAAGLHDAGVVPGNAVGCSCPISRVPGCLFRHLEGRGGGRSDERPAEAPEVEFYLANSGATAFITFSMFADEAVKGAQHAGVDKVYLVGATELPTVSGRSRTSLPSRRPGVRAALAH